MVSVAILQPHEAVEAIERHLAEEVHVLTHFGGYGGRYLQKPVGSTVAKADVTIEFSAIGSLATGAVHCFTPVLPPKALFTPSRFSTGMKAAPNRVGP